jgi:hypothetical protein
MNAELNWPTNKITVLTDRFDRALLYATHVHGGQVRKGTTTRRCGDCP